MRLRLLVSFAMTLALMKPGLAKPLDTAQVKVPALTPGGRIQVDRWVDAELGVSDPLTQIVHITRPGSRHSGTGFLLPNCRVMTAAHVIASAANDSNSAHDDLDGKTFDATDLVGERYAFETAPLAAQGGTRAKGEFIVLAHGVTIGQAVGVGAFSHEDWAVGYDEQCLADKLNLGTVDLAWMEMRKAAPANDLTELLERDMDEYFTLGRGRHLFTAGFSYVDIPGIAKESLPMYIDSKCGEASLIGDAAVDRANFNRFRALATDCSAFPGGSGQPLLAPVMNGGRVVRTADGRPKLEALGLLSNGTLESSGDPEGVNIFVAFNFETLKDVRHALYEMNGPEIDAIRDIAVRRERERRVRSTVRNHRIRRDWAPVASAALDRALSDCAANTGSSDAIVCEQMLLRPDLTASYAVRGLAHRANTFLARGEHGAALREINLALDVLSGSSLTPTEDPWQDEGWAQILLYESRATLYRSKSLIREALAESAKASDALMKQLPALSPSQRAMRSAFVFAVQAELSSQLYDFVAAAQAYDRLIEAAPSADAFNGRCYVRAASAEWPGAPTDALDRALADCNQSLALRPNDAPTLDSRGFVYLKMARYADARRDYDAALAINPGAAPTLFGRGVVKLRTGDVRGGEADIEAAKTLEPDVEATLERHGVTRQPLTAADAVKAVQGIERLLKGKTLRTLSATVTFEAVEYVQNSLLQIRYALVGRFNRDLNKTQRFSFPLTQLVSDVYAERHWTGEGAEVNASCAPPAAATAPHCILHMSGSSTEWGQMGSFTVPASSADEIARLMFRAMLAANVAERGRTRGGDARH